MVLRLAMTFPLAPGVPGGGTEDCLGLARHLRRAGAELVLLCARSAGPGRFPRRPPAAEADAAALEALAREGVETRLVPAHPLHHLLDGLPMRAAVRRLLAERPLDALIGWWHEAAFLAGPLERRGVLFAMSAAASYAQTFPRAGRWRPLRFLRERRLVRAPLCRAALVLARSEFTRRELAAFAGLPPERVRVVPCGVDARFAALERAPEPGPPRVLFFGRLSAEKGTFDALEALARAAAAGAPACRLRVAGWGDPAPVRARARALGIEGQVELLGPLARDALAAELARADLALLPSRSESFGLANAEALAAGVPVVAYAAGAVPEVVGGAGWLVPSGDREALAAALGRALAYPGERARRGALGRRHVRERYTWERAALDTLACLAEARAARARPGP